MELDKGSWILDCRHSLVLILNQTQLKVLAWEPVTGDVSRVAFSRGYVSIAIVGQLPAWDSGPRRSLRPTKKSVRTSGPECLIGNDK
jgi:hypothetical protein